MMMRNTSASSFARSSNLTGTYHLASRVLDCLFCNRKNRIACAAPPGQRAPPPHRQRPPPPPSRRPQPTILRPESDSRALSPAQSATNAARRWICGLLHSNRRQSAHSDCAFGTLVVFWATRRRWPRRRWTCSTQGCWVRATTRRVSRERRVAARGLTQARRVARGPGLGGQGLAEERPERQEEAGGAHPAAAERRADSERRGGRERWACPRRMPLARR